MATKKELLIQAALDELTIPQPMMAGEMPREEMEFIDVLLPILLPIFLDWFANCLKGPAAKKAAQIDDEARRHALIRRGRRQERKLHRKAEKLFRKPEVIEANGGKELTEAQQDAAYERIVQWTFENRDAVARAAATK